MEKVELLNILYAERQRLSDKKNTLGWSIWILMGCLISFGWMFLEHYNIYYFDSKSGFDWTQIILLTGDLCILLLGFLCIKNMIDENNTKYHSNRFSQSQLPISILLDLSISILFIVYTIYVILSISNYLYLSFLLFLSIYMSIKIIDVWRFYTIRQYTPWTWRYSILGGLVINSIITSCFSLYFHRDFCITNTKFALLLSGILSILYLLVWFWNNPLKNTIFEIDAIIDSLITVENSDIEKAYNKLIEAKLGCKYAQLFNKEFDNIKYLQLKLERITAKASSLIDDLENGNRNCKRLKEFNQLISKINYIEKQILILNSKINLRIKKAFKTLSLNNVNIKQIETIQEFIYQTNVNIELNIKVIKQLFARSQQYALNQNLLCKYANMRILCIYHRKKHLLKKWYKKYCIEIFKRK